MTRTSRTYQLLRALKDKWIQFDAAGQPFVSVESLPTEAQSVWHACWRVYDLSYPRARRGARDRIAVHALDRHDAD
jgi:hypothetical protein